MGQSKLDDEQLQKRRAWQKKYRESEGGKAKRAAYAKAYRASGRAAANGLAWSRRNPRTPEQEAQRQEHRARTVARVRELKEAGSCMDCGGKFPGVAMDYDHVRGEKTNNVASMAHAGRRWEVIEEEIAKCDLVCANCHRIRHSI